MLHIQFLKYVVIGLLSNGVLYFAYLFLTAYGLGYKTAMTLLYTLGVVQTFLFNKKWTFSHHGEVSRTFIRYIISYALGYFLNLAVLYYFVDKLLFPHQIVQGIMIIYNAFMLFILQKFWVFKQVVHKKEPKEYNQVIATSFPVHKRKKKKSKKRHSKQRRKK